MTPRERRQLELALRSARTMRHHAYAAVLAHSAAGGDSALTARLERLHREACELEADIRKALTQFQDQPKHERSSP